METFRVRAILAALAVVLCAAGSARAQPPANDCADPHWQDSLRCVVAGGEVPPPATTPPAVPAQIKEYTRVDLGSDSGARCLDGTRPVVYIDPAVGGASDRWILSFTGGGSCAAEDGNDDGVYDDGQECSGAYFGGEAGEMGTAAEPAMKNLGGSGGTSGRIMRPDPGINPVFAGFNRVRVKKCSYDRQNSRATHAGLDALLPNGDPFTYTLYQHGRRIVPLALDELRGDTGMGEGLTYTTWVEVGGAVEEQTVILPPLEHAAFVLMIGHSGGAHGLMHNADQFADYLRSWPEFDGEVRVVLDPNIEHTWGGVGHIVWWADWGSFPHCPLLGISPCPRLLPVGNEGDL